MSVVKFYTVDCDGIDCMSTHEAGATSARQAREWARESGWTRSRAFRDGGAFLADYCTDCSPRA